MAAFSRGLRSFSPRGTNEFICFRCANFSTTSLAQSGHNRWSKIKHDKGAADQKKNLQRNGLSKEIILASKLGGPDPKMNPRLATIIANAKKASLPNSLIQSSIARGQGKSTTGAALEPLSLEVILPPNIALIIEADTDNKARAMMDLRVLIKKRGGSVTPTTYLFQKRGRLAFEPKEGLGVDEIMDEAIEAGADDIEEDEEDGSLIVWTQAADVTSAAEALEGKLGLKVQSTDIIWDANGETMVELDGQVGDSVEKFREFLKEMADYPGMGGIYANVRQGNVEDSVWEEIQSCLDS